MKYMRSHITKVEIQYQRMTRNLMYYNTKLKWKNSLWMLNVLNLESKIKEDKNY